jgi:hypothetical protein
MEKMERVTYEEQYMTRPLQTVVSTATINGLDHKFLNVLRRFYSRNSASFDAEDKLNF